MHILFFTVEKDDRHSSDRQAVKIECAQADAQALNFRMAETLCCIAFQQYRISKRHNSKLPAS
jgi:hypothetical protein